MKSIFSLFKPSDRFFFGTTLVINAWLSSMSLPVFEKAFLFASGLLFVGFGLYRLADQRGPWKLRKPFQPSPWLLALAASFGVFLRFFKMTSCRPWISSDEALQGFFAIDLLRQWSWRFFYTSGQHPPLLIWMLKWFFQFFSSPFFNIWSLPAFLSTLFVFLGYGAARSFFPKNFCWVFGWLLASSFWPIYFGRFCVQGVWVPLFEMSAFLVLGAFLKAESQVAKWFYAAFLGFLVGVGTWTYTSWLAVAFFFLCLLFYGFWKKKLGRPETLLGLVFFILGSMPWLLAIFRERFGGYLVGVSMLSGFFDWKEQLLTSTSYLTTLFWGTLREPVSYGPSLGGMLNPLLSACFFLGILEFYRLRRQPTSKALGLAFLIFLLPGVLSADHVEMFRIIQLMPVLLLVAAVGMVSFLNSFPSPRRKWVFISLMVVSSLFDLFHLLHTVSPGYIPFAAKGGLQVQDENYWAYQQLEPVAQKLGPGLVFTDFILLTHNHTLSVATYHFNAVENDAFDPSKARWAAVITNVHYAPYLLKRFPGSRWHSITPGPVEDGGSAVGLIPITSRNREVFLNWIPAARYFHQLGVQAENMMNNGEEYRDAMRELPSGYPLLNGDPFLESCYGEWMAQYHESPRFDWNIRALQRAVQKGYPAANLYYKLGSFYYWNREPEKAKWAYLMAAKCRPNYTNAKEVLARLWGEER